MEVMLNKYIRHLPVVNEGKLIGIISMGDVVKAVLADQNQTIDNLLEYITDSPMTQLQSSQTTDFEKTFFYRVN
jgi:CBS domain-containing protein